VGRAAFARRVIRAVEMRVPRGQAGRGASRAASATGSTVAMQKISATPSTFKTFARPSHEHGHRISPPIPTAHEMRFPRDHEKFSA